MIASFPQFDLKAPDFQPIREMGIPELPHRKGGGQSPLIGSLEHRVHSLRRGEEKHTDVLLRHRAIEFYHPQHAMERVERR